MADISAGSAARELPEFDPGAEARAEAAERFDQRKDARADKIERLNAGEVVVDTPERKAKRAARLRRYNAGQPLHGSPVAVPSPGSQAAAADGRTLEQVINSADFVDIRFLEAGVAAARAVGRVNIRNQGERVVGYGSASLISNQLALTNHHVLPTAEVARRSAIEFNYQDGIDGQPLQPRLFRFDPDRFYLSDKDRDFAIVAVAAQATELADFGFNRLIDVEGKAVVGEFVTIVQHPRGEKKQVSLRENRVVDLLESFLHYETDTEPGSSGSPVFNDQWEVVALHHASVPAPDHAELGSIMNEGIRVSALVRAARDGAGTLPAPMAALFEGLFDDQRSAVGAPAAVPAAPAAPRLVTPGLQSLTLPESSGMTETRITVPIEIIVRIGVAPSPPVAAPAGDLVV
ncbi:MAG: endonuclease mitochondrial [Actinomycetota bacterium]|nr:endonuclease mitochondrial [Actinomycetota bacterium]